MNINFFGPRKVRFKIYEPSAPPDYEENFVNIKGPKKTNFLLRRTHLF